MRRSCVIFVCLLFGACATTPPPRSTRVYVYQNPVAALDGTWARIEGAHWLECDIVADRTATATLEERRRSGNGLIMALVVLSQDEAFERERDIDYAQVMKKCLQAKGYRVRPAIAPPMDSFSDTPEQLAANRAARHKWAPERNLGTMAALPRLLDKQLIRTVGITADGFGMFSWTELGRALADNIDRLVPVIGFPPLPVASDKPAESPGETT